MVEDVDRRDGNRRRRLPCEPGDIGPECRGPAAAHRRVRQLCAPRPGIDRVILAGFVPGLSVRRIGEVLPPLPGAVSRVAKTPDAAVAASTTATRPSCPTVWFRRHQAACAGRLRPPPRQAQGDHRPPTRPRRKRRRIKAPVHLPPPARLTGEGRRMPARRPHRPLPIPLPDGRRRVRTTNAVERRFREVRRRTRPMRTFRDRIPMERVRFAILPYRNKNDRTAAPFTVRHNS